MACRPFHLQHRQIVANTCNGSWRSAHADSSRESAPHFDEQMGCGETKSFTRVKSLFVKAQHRVAHYLVKTTGTATKLFSGSLGLYNSWKRICPLPSDDVSAALSLILRYRCCPATDWERRCSCICDGLRLLFVSFVHYRCYPDIHRKGRHDAAKLSALSTYSTEY